MASKRKDSPIIPFPNARNEDGEVLHGFSTTEPTLNTRLTFLYHEDSDTCCVGVTDMTEGQGMHMYITTETLKELIGQFSEMVETMKEKANAHS